MIRRQSLPPLAALLLFLPLLALGGACSSSGAGSEPKAAWAAETFDVASGTVLWEYAVLSVQKMGFHVGSGLDPANRVLETGWQTHLAPFRGEGYRHRARVEMEPVESGGWTVRVRVQKQTNEALVRPTDPRYADWKWTSDDLVAAKTLLQHVRTYLGPELGRGLGERAGS